ncbi:hypothetical protein [Halomicrococcus gelatinilyticus]|uniref:hypothetical protein n=1 Tax=Halomicrococcus gelatinilyticus TaxID=1702103 RepID=UPI002E0DEAE9
MTNDCPGVETDGERRVVRESEGYHDAIPSRVGRFALQRNVYAAVEWRDGERSVVCRRVENRWQALVVADGRTRTLLAGLGSKNHALWLAREYMEFGRTYDDPSVWADLPPRERSNPFRDLLQDDREASRR